MIIDSLRAFYFCVQRQSLSRNDFRRINNLNSPNSRTSRSSVLLKNSLSMRESSGEVFLESFNIIVSISILGNDRSASQLDQCILGTISGHHIRVSHAHKSYFAESSQQIKEFMLSSWNSAWVYSWNVPNVLLFDKIFKQFFSPLISVEDDIALIP